MNQRAIYIFLSISALALIMGCSQNRTKETKPVSLDPFDGIPVINYTLVKTYPHDTSLFTEGFVIQNSKLFESTGSPAEVENTKSVFGIIDLKTGKMDVKGELDKKYFGEGIVFFKDKLYQLTYKNRVGFIYDASTFKLKGRFSFENPEGWGLTTDNTSIIMSDGSYILTFLDPENLTVVKTLPVTSNGQAIYYLNELEYIKGFIYANIWTTDNIVKINPVDGKIVGRMDLSTLHNEAKSKYPMTEVLNGIAYDSVSNKIYITGKLWPYIYEIKLEGVK